MARVSTDVLRTAVIGCGRIGAFTVHKPGDDLPSRYFPTNHCAAIRATPGLKLIAVCDKSGDAARKAAALHKVKNIYTDFKLMIREQSPDIVAVATRMAERDEIISYAANHGVKGLHIEKPLAPNLDRTRACLVAIAKNDVAVSYGTVRRYMPIYQQAKRILMSGRLGALQKIVIDIPKSQLMWAHPHTIDLMVYLTDNAIVNYVQSSFAFDKKDVSKNIIDMDPVLDSALIQFKNGVSGLIQHTGGDHVRIVCEQGEIIIQIGGKSLKEKRKSGTVKNIPIRNGKSGRCVALAELRDFIRDGKPTSLTLKEFLIEQNILLALGYAGITGKKVKLSEIESTFTVTGKFNGLYP